MDNEMHVDDPPHRMTIEPKKPVEKQNNGKMS
jgi:hypothetical protein